MKTNTSLSAWVLMNLAAFLAVLIVNGLANALPLNGVGTGELSDSYPNLFVPAGVTFSIWGVIYLLLAGFVIYSLRAGFGKSIPSGFIRVISPWFLLSCAGNIIWIFAWHWRKTGLSLFFMLLILFSLIVLYLRIKAFSAESEQVSFFFVKLPFSIYLGWITVATIANVTAVLVQGGWNGWGLSETFWTIAVIGAAMVITCLHLYRTGDTGYALVILWAFLGIILKRKALGDAPPVVTAATVAIVLITLFYLVNKLLLRLPGKSV